MCVVAKELASHSCSPGHCGPALSRHSANEGTAVCPDRVLAKNCGYEARQQQEAPVCCLWKHTNKVTASIWVLYLMPMQIVHASMAYGGKVYEYPEGEALLEKSQYFSVNHDLVSAWVMKGGLKFIPGRHILRVPCAVLASLVVHSSYLVTGSAAAAAAAARRSSQYLF